MVNSLQLLGKGFLRRIPSGSACRCLSSSSQRSGEGESTGRTSLEDVRIRRLKIFERELGLQQSYVTRVEKLAVRVEHEPHFGQGATEKPGEAPKVADENGTLLRMNKRLSTPFNCAMHLSEHLANRSALAIVNGRPWDMHRPLTEDCTVRFLHFKEEDTFIINKAFWKTCSYILGYIMETAFKDEHNVELCGFPPLNVEDMCFVYDGDLKFKDWKPTSMELTCLSRIGASLGYQDHRFLRLDISAKVAKEMFRDNRFKSEQIDGIAAGSESGDTVTVYRMADHVDISRGPLMGSTRFLGRFNVTAVHDINHDKYGSMKRLQGIAIPTQLQLHAWTFNYLCQRAARFNPTQFQAPPTKPPHAPTTESLA